MTPPAYRPRPGTIPTLPVPEVAGWRSVHLVGIGGAAMSGMARLLLARGIAVSGSDLKHSRALESLRGLGADVHVGHRVEQLGAPDFVVVSSAIPADNPEVVAARLRGVPVLTRAQVLAALTRGSRTVAVSGTHGKTTTTSMVALILAQSGFDPTYVIGGDLNESGSGSHAGGGDVFVAEADESDGSFLLLEPEVGVVTSVEEDHLDFYGSRDEIESAFAAFAARCRIVVANADNEGVRRALDGECARVLWYGTGDDCDVRIVDPTLRATGSDATFVIAGGTASIALGVPGWHNVLNAAAAFGAACALGVPVESAAAALASFTGVRRRFEARGVANGATFVDDYAHNPGKLRAILRTARLVPHERVVAIFQPHRYTRTQMMWRELGESLADADVVVLTDVYGAGERPIPGVSGKLVLDALADAAPGSRIVYLPRRSDLAPFLAGEIREGDLVLTLGAGDITMVADETLERMGEGAG